MVKEKENIYLTVLNNVLSAHFDPGTFSIYGPSDSSACMQKENGKWHVYGFERGHKFSECEYGNIVEACNELIRRVAIRYNPDKYIDLFLSSLVSDRIK